MNNLLIQSNLMAYEPGFSAGRSTIRTARILVGFVLLLLMFFNGFIPFACAQTPSRDLPDPVTFRITVELGDTEKMERWLNNGLNPNFLGDKLGSALHIAAWNGDIKMMALVISKGARIDLPNKNGETPLHLAALQGKTSAAEWLISKGAPINPPDSQDGRSVWSALHYAAFSGKKELVTRLLDKGADLNARAPNGTTPLMAAIYEGKRDVADFLIRQGADRTVKNDWGDGAFEWAMKYNQIELAQLLSSPEQFASAYSRASAERSKPRRSEPPPPELLKLLAEREQLLNKKEPVDKIDSAIAALRAKLVRQSVADIRDKTKPSITLLSPLYIRPTESQKKRLQATP